MSIIGIWTASAADRLRTTGAVRSLQSRWDARCAVALLLLLLLAATVGPSLVVDPTAQDYTAQLRPPSADHPLGTDGAGRDLLARTVVGASSSLGAALLVSAISATIGLTVGMLAAVAGGAVDALVARATDVLLGLPGLILTLAIVGMLGPGFANLILAMVVTSWAPFARLSRTSALDVLHRGHVRASRMAGASRARITIDHVLPPVAGRIVVLATLGLAEVVLALAGLSFLGLGAQPPTPEWGTMLAAARGTLTFAPWQAVGPVAGIALTVLAANLLGEAVRDVTDAKEPR